MTTNDPIPYPDEPLAELFSEVFDLVDDTVDRVADTEVDDQLRRLFKRAALPACPTKADGDGTVTVDFSMQYVERVLAPQLTQLHDVRFQLETAQVELNAVRAEAARATERAAEAAKLANEIVDAANARAKEIVRGADAYVDAALDRAQEILADAQAGADEKLADAEQRAAGIVAAATSKVPGDGLPSPLDISKIVIVGVIMMSSAGLLLVDTPGQAVIQGESDAEGSGARDGLSYVEGHYIAGHSYFDGFTGEADLWSPSTAQLQLRHGPLFRCSALAAGPEEPRVMAPGPLGWTSREPARFVGHDQWVLLGRDVVRDPGDPEISRIHVQLRLSEDASGGLHVVDDRPRALTVHAPSWPFPVWVCAVADCKHWNFEEGSSRVLDGNGLLVDRQEDCPA